MIEEFMGRVIFKLHVEILTGTFKEENKGSCGGSIENITFAQVMGKVRYR